VPECWWSEEGMRDHPRIMAMDASASCKAKLATAEHHSLQLPATSRKCRKKQLPMLIFYWMPD